MSANFVAALEAEINALREALSQDVRYVRLRELERVRELYSDPENFLRSGHATAPFTRAPVRPAARRTSPERARAIEVAREYVKGRFGPVPTAEIYDHITSLGIAIGGEEPRNNLSAMLSQSGLFQSNGRVGWTLKEDAEKADGGRTNGSSEHRSEGDLDDDDLATADAHRRARHGDLDDDIPF